MAIGDFRFPLVCVRDGGEGANSGGGFYGVNGSGIVGGGGDVPGFAEMATAEYELELEGVKDLTCV